MGKKEKGKGLIAEFKAFITRGNIVDMAVGIIIGGAFTAIVTALTGHILTPLINWALSYMGGDGALDSARTILGKPVYLETGEIDWTSTNYIDWGAFISAIINFLLIALVLFFIVKALNTADKKAKEAKARQLEAYYQKHPEERPVEPEPEAPKPTELDVLNEIRDLLKEKKQK